jgi:hypothetical protein
MAKSREHPKGDNALLRRSFINDNQMDSNRMHTSDIGIENKTDVQAVIQTQLLQDYSVIAQERANRVKARNWAVTIWVAYLTLLSSGHYFPDKVTATFILGIIITVFWIVEGFHQSLL